MLGEIQSTLEFNSDKSVSADSGDITPWEAMEAFTVCGNSIIVFT